MAEIRQNFNKKKNGWGGGVKRKAEIGWNKVKTFLDWRRQKGFWKFKQMTPVPGVHKKDVAIYFNCIEGSI